MSYVRWSTVVGHGWTRDQEIQSLHDVGWEKTRELMESEPGAEKSDWYIFWHHNGLCHKEQTPDNQLLSIWNCRCPQGLTPTFTLAEVKHMYQTDDWGNLPITQKHVLLDCVQRWLAEVEKDAADGRL